MRLIFVTLGHLLFLNAVYLFPLWRNIIFQKLFLKIEQCGHIISCVYVCVHVFMSIHELCGARVKNINKFVGEHTWGTEEHVRYLALHISTFPLEKGSLTEVGSHQVLHILLCPCIWPWAEFYVGLGEKNIGPHAWAASTILAVSSPNLVTNFYLLILILASAVIEISSLKD